MNQSQKSFNLWHWLGLGLLLALIGGLIYLSTSVQPGDKPGKPAPSFTPAPFVSPLTVDSPLPVALNSPLSPQPSPTLVPPTPPPTPSPPLPSPALTLPEGALSLTVLHTNDTWGYLRPCG